MTRPLDVRLPDDCMLNARFPAAVAAGNVETSQRIVDTVLGALATALPDRIPAASSGTMNSLALSAAEDTPTFTYYETIAGGSGAAADHTGESAVQTHMTNTLNTPAEALEMEFPLRVRTCAVEPHTGGPGQSPGGDGMRREIEALAEVEGTLLADRRNRAPYGLAGGRNATPGRAEIERADGTIHPLQGKDQFRLHPGDILRIITPGGGGFGAPRE